MKSSIFHDILLIWMQSWCYLEYKKK